MDDQASRTHILIAYISIAKTLKELGLRVNIGTVIEAIEEVCT
ncbi:MAG: hypothetical protein QXZ41_05030 [Ignisphaera sp.]